jgi:MFS-type transporter involved in bile tolerance (Atg22 family)
MYFWIFAGTELFQNSARTVYSANLADIQEKTRGTSTLAAGYNAALQNVVSIIMAPILGAFFDRFGWRMPFISISAALYMIVFALIGLTTINPTGPIVLSSIALASNVMPIQASLPIMIHDQNLMGTAFGTWSAFVSACPT